MEQQEQEKMDKGLKELKEKVDEVFQDDTTGISCIMISRTKDEQIRVVKSLVGEFTLGFRLAILKEMFEFIDQLKEELK